MSAPATPFKRSSHARSRSTDSDELTKQQPTSGASTPRTRKSAGSVSCLHLTVAAANPEEGVPGADQSWLDIFISACLHDLNDIALSLRSWFTPARTGHHWVIFSPVLITTLLLVFVFAAAQYPYWTTWQNWQNCITQARAGTDCAAGPLLPTNSTGLANLAEWTSLVFPVQYLRDLGGFYAPDVITGQACRWFTSQFVHGTIGHLIGNLVLLCILALPLERRLGWWRVLLTWCTSVVAGNLWSLVLDDPCTLVVGASGGVCGLLGLFICDVARDWRRLPVFKLLMLLSVLCALLISTAAQEWNVSQFSHLGGIICGLLCGLLFAHDQTPHKRFMWITGASSLSLMLGLQLIWSYLSVLPNLQCVQG